MGMRIFLAGATGAVGKRLVPLLLAEGHEVTGTTRSAERVARLEAAGAKGVVMDALDPEGVTTAVTAAEPEVVIHQLTGLSGGVVPRRIDRDFELTNRLRTEGTDNLLRAARQGGVRRFVAQSYTGWPYAREGGPVKTEEDPLDPHPPAKLKPLLDAIRHLEDAVTQAEGIAGLVLRYGAFYGPGTSIAPGGEHWELVTKRRFPIVGGGGGVWSLVHIDDAASAALAAAERGAPGLYNVTDDEPAPVSDWVPGLAKAAGANPPRRVPAWLGRLGGGEAGLVMLTESRGASNEKAKRELGWRPRHPTWRDGFRTLGGPASPG